MIASGVRALREMVALTRGLKNLQVLAASGLVSALGSGLLNPVLPLFLQGRGLDLERIGVVFTLGSLLPMFLQPVLGGLSDRFSRKGFVVGLSLATSLMLPLLTVFEHPLPLAAALVMKLMFDRSAAPVSAAMVGDFAPRENRATIFALLGSATNLAFVAALVASWFVVEALSVERVFLLAGALYMAGSLVLLGLEESPPGSPAAGGRKPAWQVAWDGVRAPLVYVLGTPGLAPLFLYQGAFSFALSLFPIYLPLYAVELGAPQSLVGPLVATSWLVYALIQPLGGRLSDRLPRRRPLIQAGLAGMVACSTLLALAGWAGAAGLWLLLGGWVLIAIPDGLFRPSAQALLVELAPAQERGRFMGALGACGSLANVVAPLTYGVVAERFGLQAAFLVCSASVLLALTGMALAREPSASSPVLVSNATGAR